MSDNAVAKALHDGLDRLRERGLTKGQLVDRQSGAVCLVGALVDATPANCHGIDVDYEPFALLDAVAREQYPDRCRRGWSGCAIDFNNHDATTQEDVERVYEKAIVRAYEMEATR